MASKKKHKRNCNKPPRFKRATINKRPKFARESIAQQYNIPPARVEEFLDKVLKGGIAPASSEDMQLHLSSEITDTISELSKSFSQSFLSTVNENGIDLLQSMKKYADYFRAQIAEMAELQETNNVKFDKPVADALMSAAMLLTLFSNLSEQLEEYDFSEYAQIMDITPYLEEEIKKPEYGGKSLAEIIEESKDENGTPIKDSLYAKAENAAKRARKFNLQLFTKGSGTALPQITIAERGVKSVDYPLDKINSQVWTLLSEASKDGQISFSAERKGSKDKADILYSIDFAAIEHEIKITKNLTPFDKRVYIAANGIYNSGYEFFTLSQLYAAMGNTGRPSANDIKKMNESITKMSGARIFLDNSQENELYPKYERMEYDGSLLPMERVNAIVNGQPAEGVIHLFREGPLITFARQRGQITTISRKLLESPLNKTDANLRIDDYLIERIAHIKNKKSKLSNKILYKTIYENADITTKMQRNRAKDKIIKYLEHYKACGFIKDYKDAADGITIIY